jgi:regulator of PEP synthase PpsR (kinase-PPPase family)
MNRQVFMISDGTGITAESLGNSLVSQFEQITFEKQTIPYIDTMEKAKLLVERLNLSFLETGNKPLVFMTLVDPHISAFIKNANASVFDLFNTFLKPLEEELHLTSSNAVGRAHGVLNLEAYTQRIEAVNYSLSHDDGINLKGYEKADIILVGVSRCGKTPSCLYMALQFGILAANYPFAEDELSNFQLPPSLKPFKKKLFGLTIDPNRLQNIRSERIPNSNYASLEQCRLEIAEVEAMYKNEHIPYLNTTQFSIEEITTKIMAAAGIQRKI